MRYIIFAGFLTSFFMPSMAHAHLGHVGELAGHGHLLGVGALVAAAALAALLLKPEKDKEEEETAEDEALEGEATS